MKQIAVTASRNYTVSVGSGLLETLGTVIRQECPKAEKVCIVSDETVWSLYGDRAKKCLESSGFSVYSYVFTPGESSKNGTTYWNLLNHLATASLTRTDCLVALGGGVVGDLTGFAAATYLRGVPYVQVPTTLLAMVDSSVGGKTGIDLPSGKNLCGAFYQPWAVLCDTDTLQTLPESHFRDGCAEMIKYGVLFDPDLMDILAETGLSFPWEDTIARCIRWKRDVVANDEFDTGSRKLLNLGHTIGHAIEKASDYTISHGQAVAAGMAIMSRATHCPQTQQIQDLLHGFGLPIRTTYSAEILAQYALSDKKRQGSTIDFIVPLSIGNCVLVPTPVAQVEDLIREGL